MNLQFWKRKPKRTVLLFSGDEAKIVKAVECQSGWVARYYDNDKRWSLLCQNGKIYPPSFVDRWSPHSGWDGTETFPSLPNSSNLR